MQRRISLSFNPEDIEPDDTNMSTPISDEVEAPVAPLPPNLTGARSSSATQEEQDIDRLFRAGIVTHQIKNPETLDPMFAISQLHDLPEIKFAAAFQDGFLLLGCPEGPPERIAEMVSPIALPEPLSAPSSALDSKLDQLGQRIDELQSGREAQLTTALERIDTISARLEFLVDELLPDTVDQTELGDQDDSVTLASLHEQLENLIRNSDQPSLAEGAFERIETSVSGLAAGAEERSQELQATLDNVKQVLEEVSQRAQPEAEPEAKPSNITTLLDQRLADIFTLVSEMREVFEAIKPPQDHDGNSSKAVEQAVANLSTRLDEILANLGQDQDQTAAIEQLQDQVSSLVTMGNPSVIQQKLNDLADEVRKLAVHRPKIVLDLTEQRIGSTAVTTAMSSAIKRIEATLDQMVELPTQAEGEISNAYLLEHLRTLQVELCENLAPSADLTSVEGRLDGLQRDINRLTTPIETMVAGVDTLSEIGRSRVEALKESLDQIKTYISDPPTPQVDLEPVLAKIEARAVQTTDETSSLFTPAPTGHISLDEMGNLFAEMVAAQIKRNAKGADDLD